MQQPPDTTQSTATKAAERLLLDRLKRMGVVSWHVPLLCFPKSFLDYSQISTLKQALPRTDLVPEPRIFTLIVSQKSRVVEQAKKRLI